MELQNDFVLILMDKQEKKLLEDYAEKKNQTLTSYCFNAIQNQIKLESGGISN